MNTLEIILMNSNTIRFFVYITLSVVLILPCIAQKMSVSRFYLAETDLTANTEGSIIYDQNGDKCALIKIETTQRGFTFDGGSLGISKTIERSGEIWLYVPHGLKRLTISHPQLGILRNCDLGVAVQKARTYVLELTTDEVVTTVINTNSEETQFLELKITPSNARVVINGVREMPNEEGVVIKELFLGSYNCRVLAENYHTYEGIITINDPQNRHVVDVTLKPAFGYLQVIAGVEYNNADVYVDNTKMCTLPIQNNLALKSGTHKIVISNPLYLPFETTVNIQDGAVCQLHPGQLVSNHAIVTINAMTDAAIWVDNQHKGTGLWEGALSIGSHIIECKKEGFRSTLKEVYVASTSPLTINCDEPQPIYTTTRILSTPVGADVYIDDSKVGKTPYISQTVLIGTHKIRLEKEGYKTEDRDMIFKESNENELAVNMSEEIKGASVNVTNEITSPSIEIYERYNSEAFVVMSIPSGAATYIDKEYIGTTPLVIDSITGMHDVLLQYPGYKRHKEKIEFEKGKIKNIKLKHIYCHLKVMSEPAKVSVYVDGEYLGETPLVIQVEEPGWYALTLKKEGYINYHERIKVQSTDMGMNIKMNRKAE